MQAGKPGLDPERFFSFTIKDNSETVDAIWIKSETRLIGCICVNVQILIIVLWLRKTTMGWTISGLRDVMSASYPPFFSKSEIILN